MNKIEIIDLNWYVKIILKIKCGLLIDILLIYA